MAMKRRDAIRALVGGAIASQLGPVFPVFGQAKVRRAAFVTGAPERTLADWLTGFREGMKDLGYQEGRNIAIDYRYGGGIGQDYRKMAAEALAGKPEIFITQAGLVHAAAALTTTIPIIAIYSGDLVDAGLVKGLANPGRNISGMQLMALDLVGKRIEILKEMVPSIKRISVVASPNHPGVHRERDVSVAAANKLGLTIAYYPVKDLQELEMGLAAAYSAGTDALVLFPDGVTNAGRERIAAFALEHKLPTVSGWDVYALAGGLVTYGPNMRVCYRQLAGFVDRTLKGVHPSTMPIELPTVFELVVNMKTARALGVKVPQSVLVRADRVIE
jgi:putative tryptophan/tyrosine transport system substrate-binding protein